MYADALPVSVSMSMWNGYSPSYLSSLLIGTTSVERPTCQPPQARQWYTFIRAFAREAIRRAASIAIACVGWRTLGSQLRFQPSPSVFIAGQPSNDTSQHQCGKPDTAQPEAALQTMPRAGNSCSKEHPGKS
jgi:hypothetical protein